MKDCVEPNKEAVRHWLQQRQRAVEPPPPIDQIRAALGWQRTPAGQPSLARKQIRSA
jgi:hypothetical protein